MILKEFEHLAGRVTIIAFAGKARTGKSICCNYITQKYPEFKKLSFASPLKNEFCKEKGIDRSELDDASIKESHRFNIQRFSEKYLSRDKYHFLKLALKEVNPGDHVVFDDLRYLENEFYPIVGLGGTPVKLHSTLEDRIKRGYIPNPEIDNHQSEVDLDLPDAFFYSYHGDVIDNFYSLERLKLEAYAMAEVALYG
jgi:phosphomevalonate kinase